MATITCPSCQSTYEIDASLLSKNLDAKGERHLRCAECKTQFSYKPVLIPAAMDLDSGSMESSGPTAEPGTDGLDLVANPEKRFGIPSTPESIDQAPDAVELNQNTNKSKALSADTLRREPVPGEHKTPKRMVGFRNGPLGTENTSETIATRKPVNRKAEGNGFMTSLLVILTFLLLTAFAVWWVWTNKPEWLSASNRSGSDAQTETASVALANDPISQEIIEDEIMSLPLARPEIKGQKVETKPAGDLADDRVELFLAGVLQNQSDQAVRLEMLRAIALDSNGKVAKSWIFSPGARTLAKTEVLPFSNRTTWPKGEKLTVKFGWESAIAKLPEAIEFDAAQ